MSEYELIPHRGKNAICIAKEPEEDTRYCVGVDGAWGVGQDYTSIQVFSCRIPFEQVAWFHSKTVNTVDGSQVMVDLGRYYNKAMLVIETRAPGNSYQDNAIEKYGYSNLYQVEQRLDEDPTISSKFGICTTETWKSLLINETKALLEHYEDGKWTPQTILHDSFTVLCFCNFVHKESGKIGAAQGAFDDPVMSTMLALHGCSIHPQAPRTVEAGPKDEDVAFKKYLLDRHFSQELKALRV